MGTPCRGGGGGVMQSDLYLNVLFINVISVLIKLGKKRSGYVKCN